MPSSSQTVAARPRVFLSHSSIDKPLVRQLKKDIDPEGFDCWIDENEIEVSDPLPQEISDALETSDYFIANFSKNFAASKWAQQELTAAVALEKSGRIKRVIFARMDDTPIPALYHGNLYADFRGDYNGGLHSVVRALTGRRDAAPTASVSVVVDRAKLVPLLDTLDLVSLTQVIGRITPRFAHDNQMLPVPVRVQALLAWAEGGVGCGLNEVARVVVELFPATKAQLPPFM